MRPVPIIFIHYGDSPYLRFTLHTARVFNPNARVILLGDRENRDYQALGIEHHEFANYSGLPEIAEFERVFKFVAGREHGKEFWVYFVFKRWFYMYSFIRLHNIPRFWTFDSDTLIISELQSHVDKFSHVDCTEQCNGMCMNGLINNQEVVKGYIDTINELFQNEEYLDRQRQDFERHPNWAFTEMRAFAEYKRRIPITTMRLNSIIDGETFDDAICQSHNMQMQRGMKKLYFRNGSIYTFHLPTQRFVKLITINMSSVPLSLMEEVYLYAVNNHTGKRPKSIRVIRTWTRVKYSPTHLRHLLIKIRKQLVNRVRRGTIS